MASTRIVWKQGYYRVSYRGKFTVVRVWLKRRAWWQGGNVWMVSYTHPLGHEATLPLDDTGLLRMLSPDAVVFLGDKNPEDGGMLLEYGMPY
jgi:hypothetical protein